MDYYRLEDVLDKDGCVSREKLANCTFARLRPGDYVSASFSAPGSDYDYYCGCVFAKIVSVQMPKKTMFSGHPGGILAELPDGSRVEFLRFDSTGHNHRRVSYFASKQVEQYFTNNCFPECSWRPYCASSEYVTPYPTDRRGELKDAMMKEQERRQRRQEELRQQEQVKRQAEMAACQHAAEEARRNAAVSDRELDDLFRG